MITITTHTLNTVDEATRRTLRKLTLVDGIMRIWIDGEFRRRQVVAFIARTDTRIVGWSALRTAWADRFIGVYVHSRYRRRGVGKQLLCAAATYAKDNNISNVVVRYHSPAGKRLFEGNCPKLGLYIEENYY